jgi:hypothetical protein
VKHVASPNRCHYCQRRVYPAGSHEVIAMPGCRATKDHVIPKSLGIVADEDRQRTVIACEDCNNIKGDAPVDQFVFWLAQGIKGERSKRARHFREFRALLSVAGFEAAKREALQARRVPAPEMPPPRSIADIVRMVKS